MKTIKVLGISAAIFALASCASSSNEKNGAANDSTTCFNNHDCATCPLNNGIVVTGVAQEGDYEKGQITITTIPGCEPKTFDYSNSDPDQIMAWQAGDTVSIFIESHQHGDVAHDSITAIKPGTAPVCPHSHNHEGHSHECSDHDHNHSH